MKVAFKRSFLKDLKKLKNKTIQHTIYSCILQIESVEYIGQIKNIKQLKGYDSHYRIRIGDFRIGVKHLDGNIYFVVFDHRKDFYKIFP